MERQVIADKTIAQKLNEDTIGSHHITSNDREVDLEECSEVQRCFQWTHEMVGINLEPCVKILTECGF